MATKSELEGKVENLEREFNEFRELARKLSKQNAECLAYIAQLRDQLSDTRTELNRVKNQPTVRQESDVSRY